MPAATDFRTLIMGRLWRAILLRRSLVWVATLLPLLLAVLLLHAKGVAGSGPWLLPLAWGVLAVLDAWRLHRRVQAEWTHWLDAAIPALEDSTALLANEPQAPVARLQRQRLLARLADALKDEDCRAIARHRFAFRVLPLAASLLVAGSCWAWQQSAAPQSPAPAKAAPLRSARPGDVLLCVTPPAYTGVAPFESDAREITVPQYSDVRWCYRRSGEAASAIELGDGQVLALDGESGKACAAWTASESIFWRARHQPGARHNIRVTPDLAPEVAVLAPTETVQVLPHYAQSVQMSVSVRDDYGIARASLHMTLARGSGENIRFSDREMPLPQGKDARTRQWARHWALAELGMEPGDELYFFVRASDNAPDRPHITQSPTYTLRLPAPNADSLEASALPAMVKAENLRSQRQIIIDTEQLVADAPKLAQPEIRARSERIAGDQAKLRLRYGKFLGEESSLFGGDDDDHGNDHGEGQAAQGGFGNMGNVLAQFGHAHDEAEAATIFDPQTKEVLRRALKAMWDAEKDLRAITPKSALPPEYKALAAIKELQQAERVYLHRTAFVPPAIKEEKRMTGELLGAQSTRRAQGEAPDWAPPEVRELVQALAGDGALPALWSKAARRVIAERIRNDEQRLDAQRAVQDVADGCGSCRQQLRAWLRSTLDDAPVVLQARPQADSKFRQAWRGKE